MHDRNDRADALRRAPAGGARGAPADALRGALRDLRADLAAVLWPTSCVSCGYPDRDCCDTCVGELRADSGRVTRVRVPSGDTVWAAGWYEGPLRALLVACKHGGRTGFARVLGERLSGVLREALSEALNETRSEALNETPNEIPQALSEAPNETLREASQALDDPVLIVTAPSRASRVRERGYRHVDLIVRAALRHERGDRGRRPSFPVPLRLQRRALRSLPGRTGQVGLDAEARTRNAALIAVPAAARQRLHGARVVLVDDVVTTGATVAAAREALAAAGAQVVAVVALCVVERRSEMRHARNENQSGTRA